MSSSNSFVWTSREDVSLQLATHLSRTAPPRWNQPRGSPHRDNVAILLARLASIEHRVPLRSIVMDRREAADVRVRALAALCDLSNEDFASLLDDSPLELDPPVTGRAAEWARKHYEVPLACVVLAVGNEQQLQLARARVDRCTPRERAEILLAGGTRAAVPGRWTNHLLAELHRVWIAADRAALIGESAPHQIGRDKQTLNDAVAWSTRSDPDTARLLYDAMVDTPEDIACVVAAATCPTFIELSRARPDLRHRAGEVFALTSPHLLELFGPIMLLDRIERAVRDARAADRTRTIRDVALRAVAVLRDLASGSETATRLLAEWGTDEPSSWEIDRLLPALVECAGIHAADVLRPLAIDGVPAVRSAVVDWISRAPCGTDLPALWAAVEPTAPPALIRPALRALDTLGICGPHFERVLERLAPVDDPFVPLYVAMARARAANSSTALARIRGEALRSDMGWGYELSQPRIEAIDWLARRRHPDDVALFARIVRDHAGCPCGACVAYPIAAARALAAFDTPDARTALLRASLDTPSIDVLDASTALLDGLTR